MLTVRDKTYSAINAPEPITASKYGVLLEFLLLTAHNPTGIYAPPTAAKKTASVNAPSMDSPLSCSS